MTTDGPITRRGFLATAASVAGTGALAACMPTGHAPAHAQARSSARLLSGASARPVSARPAAAGTRAAAAGPGPADWRALRQALSSRRLLQPGQAG